MKRLIYCAVLALAVTSASAWARLQQSNITGTSADNPGASCQPLRPLFYLDAGILNHFTYGDDAGI